MSLLSPVIFSQVFVASAGRSIQTGDAIEVGDQQAIVRDSAAGPGQVPFKI